LNIGADNKLFAGLGKGATVWMSHGDSLSKMPNGFQKIARTKNSPYAAIADLNRNIFGVQFHPEVKHTPQGRTIIENFVFNICGDKADWTMASFIDEEIKKIKLQVGKGKVLLRPIGRRGFLGSRRCSYIRPSANS